MIKYILVLSILLVMSLSKGQLFRFCFYQNIINLVEQYCMYYQFNQMVHAIKLQELKFNICAVTVLHILKITSNFNQNIFTNVFHQPIYNSLHQSRKFACKPNSTIKENEEIYKNILYFS